MSTKTVAKKETFYERMEKDRHRREEQAKLNDPKLDMKSTGFSYKSPGTATNEGRSSTSPSGTFKNS